MTLKAKNNNNITTALMSIMVVLKVFLLSFEGITFEKREVFMGHGPESFEGLEPLTLYNHLVSVCGVIYSPQFTYYIIFLLDSSHVPLPIFPVRTSKNYTILFTRDFSIYIKLTKIWR